MPFPFETLGLTVVLAALTWCGVLAVLSTLAARIRGQKLRHNLVVESRRRRLDYLASLPGAQVAGEADVVEDEPPLVEERAAA